MYRSGKVAGRRLAEAGWARESCLQERAGAGWHNLSRTTLYKQLVFMSSSNYAILPYGNMMLNDIDSLINSFISLISASDKTHSLLQLVRKQVTVHVKYSTSCTTLSQNIYNENVMFSYNFNSHIKLLFLFSISFSPIFLLSTAVH